ncbi:MAG: hypothetical protein LH467_07930, partial [Gemmatimonadaceae bacterium]|nr:hypothetical protein [Gemmatimonadaceae bacterium]
MAIVSVSGPERSLVEGTTRRRTTAGRAAKLLAHSLLKRCSHGVLEQAPATRTSCCCGQEGAGLTDETLREESKAAVLTARPATHDPERLAADRETGLLDTEDEAAFDRLTRFAVRLVRIPASLISLVDDKRD